MLEQENWVWWSTIERTKKKKIKRKSQNIKEGYLLIKYMIEENEWNMLDGKQRGKQERRVYIRGGTRIIICY